ncbi:alpha/beta fold hydrolase [Pseudomonas fluorescens]|uniref:alpha/beta fold hydrolase n=1 Tax=Pseudomonas fluorescens TaxID=294 RepID=UPI001BE5D43F|nr:alpha/beta fold hydrolase [Pseudomonas fluorescens]MBT2375391.1 alpha/beta fold hydrolase [Pseudomonas fluorescens]
MVKKSTVWRTLLSTGTEANNSLKGHIILSHGFTSGPLSKGLTTGPDGTKVTTLSSVAESLGWSTHRPDFRSDDIDPYNYALCIEPRLRRLKAAITASPSPPILMGTSIGAYVSALAASQLPVAGLFLLALPTRIPGDNNTLAPKPVPSLLVHGYDDDICPVDDALNFARRHGMPSLLLKKNHFFENSLSILSAHFTAFLATVSE